MATGRQLMKRHEKLFEAIKNKLKKEADIKILIELLEVERELTIRETESR